MEPWYLAVWLIFYQGTAGLLIPLGSNIILGGFLSMKKVRKFVAFAATTCIVLSTAVSAFAADLTVTEKNLVNQNTKQVIGTYPEISGYDDLNKEIAEKLWYAYQYNADDSTANSKNVFNATYDGVEYKGDFAKITVSLNYKQSHIAKGEYTEKAVWVVNTATKATATLADFDAATDGAAAAAEPTIDAALADRMVKLSLLEKLNYTLTFDEALNSVRIDDAAGKYLTIVVVGINSYFKSGAATNLLAAPALDNNNTPDDPKDDTVLVPAEFFAKILGLKVEADGATSVKLSK
jgi:hypothetical protein